MKLVFLAILISAVSADLAGHIENSEVHYFKLQEPLNNTKTKYRVSPRILNGRNAYHGQFPFVARVLVTRHNEQTGIIEVALCTGSLIHERFALTAGHCVVVPQLVRDVEFIFGTVDASMQGLRIHSMDFWRMLDKEKLVNDFAIFRFSQPIERILPFIDFIRIPTPEEIQNDYVGSRVTIIGWGADNTGQNTKNLKYAQFTVQDTQRCIGFTESEMCMMDYYQATDIGDSGGPVIIQNEKEAVQIGVLVGTRSVLYRQYRVNYYSATRISTFFKFIEKFSGFSVRKFADFGARGNENRN